MTVTFTLQNQYSGATFVAGPFNISGTTDGGITTQLATGVTKTELLTGYTINDIDNATTGGTIASTGTCTTTQDWFTEPVVQTATLEVYGKDLNTVPQNATITYSINSGATVNLVTLTPLLANCSLIGTITGLSVNDVVRIESADTYPLAGSSSSTCPSTVSNGIVLYDHVVGVTGTDYVAITINSDVMN